MAMILPARGATLDYAAPPGKNYAKAEFRLWWPDRPAPLRAVVALLPGSNDDGRPDVTDPVWQSFATKQGLALVGCHFTDREHAQPFLEEYVQVSQGSGQALLDALAALAPRAGHPELATAPLLLWGMSAGGQFNYEFAAWKPERVAAFVVNKGGVYYTALAPQAARRVPGILFTGEKDMPSRTQIITGLFALNRRAGALWALAEEPGAGHVVGRSREVALILYEEVLALRGNGLAPLDENSGFVGDPRSRDFRAAREGVPPDSSLAWLPSLRVAQAWQALVRGEK